MVPPPRRLVALLGVCLFSAPALAFDAEATTRVVSVDSAQAQGNGHSGTGPGYALSLSADGRTAVFLSVASNLVAGDTNGVRDVFVHDCVAATTTRVSVATGGAQANGVSSQPTISGDGRYVAFSTSATNLGGSDANGWDDVYMHDRLTGVTRLVSRTSAFQSGNGTSENPRFSADGRFLSFWSAASNLVPGDTNGTGDVFVYDRVADSLERVSVSSSEAQGNDNSFFGWISGDGRYVAFVSDATNLDGVDTNGAWDVFVRDRHLGTTARIGPAAPSQWNANATYPSISDTGRWVAFQSSATNVVPGDTNAALDVFVHDRATGATTRVSVASDGTEGDGASEDAAICASGQYVTFESLATTLVPGDTNGWKDIFRHRLDSGVTELVSRDRNGLLANSLSAGPSTSASGRHVAFVSFADDLTLADTNAAPDVFVRDLGPPEIGSNYCVGATNSVGLSGRIEALGSARASDNELFFTASDIPPNKPGIFFYGPNQVQVPFGDGFRCVGGSTQRLQPVVQTDADGYVCRSVDTTAEPVLSDITNVAPIIMNFQFWHRDAMGSTNLTDAVEVRFVP